MVDTSATSANFMRLEFRGELYNGHNEQWFQISLPKLIINHLVGYQFCDSIEVLSTQFDSTPLYFIWA